MDNNEDIITDKDPEVIFEMLEMIGQGNYGEVYKAIQKKTGKAVAVKKWNINSDIESLK